MGEFAVTFGGPKVREHVEKGIALARKRAESVLGGAGDEGGVPDAADDVPSPPPRAATGSRGGELEGGEPAAGGVHRDHHDDCRAGAGGDDARDPRLRRAVGPRRSSSASTALPPSELDAVRAYEEAHRARRTILYKIEQLTS